MTLRKWDVVIPKGVAGLEASSLILAHQVRTVSVDRLPTAHGHLDSADLRAAVENALRLWLDLT